MDEGDGQVDIWGVFLAYALGHLTSYRKCEISQTINDLQLTAGDM